MKKVLYGILVVILLALTLVYFYLPQFVYQKITDFEPFTFERVLEDSTWLAEYELGNYQKPEDYGYYNTEEVSFYSAIDSLVLSGWFIKSSKKTDSTIFLIHGRTSNRLKTMKYLGLLKEKGIDTLYNVFLADMRNSGKSTTARTFMGYSFAQDIAGGLAYLKNTKKQEHFILYSFSMGAMASYTFLDRRELQSDNYDIQKIITDSPLTNVEQLLMDNASKLKLPEFVYENTLELFNEEIDNYASKLKLSELMKGHDIPMLIIQSNHDLTTSAEQTKKEVEKLNSPLVKTWFMDSASHVKIYTNPKYSSEYVSRVNDFIRN